MDSRDLMAPGKTIVGVWGGPFAALHISGAIIEPGETAAITEADLASGHWHPVEKPAIESTREKASV